MRLHYQIPTILQRLYRGVVWRVKPSSKVIYITFDDGCIPQVTPKVLHILKQYNIKATFFLVGNNIKNNPQLIKQILDEGHCVGNHTFSHLKGIKTTNEEYFESIRQTDELIKQSGGQTGLFRPPYGKITFKQKKILQKKYKIILWDILTHDYDNNYNPETILSAIKKYSRNGSIILFHDSIKAENNMLSVLSQAIDFWKSNGYQFDTLKTLINNNA